jgi:hypothetical protein
MSGGSHSVSSSSAPSEGAPRSRAADSQGVGTEDVAVYAWLAALGRAAGNRVKSKYWLSLLYDAIRAHELLVRAEFEKPALRS